MNKNQWRIPDSVKTQLKTKLSTLSTQIKSLPARFKALPPEQRKAIYTHGIAFMAGIVLTSVVVSISNRSGQSSSTAPVGASAPAINPNATDWRDMVNQMCKPDSELNLLAMKFDFPFAKCQNDRGRIDASCVQQDMMRFKPTLSAPYQQNLGAVEAKLTTLEDNGGYLMNYAIALNDAVYQQVPLQAIAIRISMDAKNSSEPLGWQTPYLVVQDDFSNVKNVLANQSPEPQVVYYANLPANSDALPGPFDSPDEARAVSKKAGGNPAKITKHIITVEAQFNDQLNAVTLGCVSTQLSNKK